MCTCKERASLSHKHIKEGCICHILKNQMCAQVHDIVMGAMLAAEPRINTEVKMKVPHRNVCFEVRGCR